MSRTLIPIDAEDYGEAMAALSPQRRAWVLSWIFDCADQTEAAEIAGCAFPKQQGYEIAHRPDVQLAIKEITNKLGTLYGPKLLRVQLAIAMDTKAKNADRLKAAAEVMDRFGYRPVAESRLDVVHHLPEAEMDRRILALAAELGLPEEMAKKLLIDPNSKVTDAEFVEVPQPIPDELRDPEDMTPEEVAADKKRVRSAKRRANVAERQGSAPKVHTAKATPTIEDLI